MKARIVSVGVTDGHAIIEIRFADEHGGASIVLSGGSSANAAVIATSGWLNADAEMEIKLKSGDKWVVLS